MAAAPSSGEVSPAVTFSRFSFTEVAISAQVGIAGGAAVEPSCSPNIATFGSSASFGSSQAAWTAGGAVASSYHMTGVSGRLTKSIQAHAAALFGASLKTTKLLPPTKDVPAAESLPGTGAAAHPPPLA